MLGAEEFDDVSEIQITSLQIDLSPLNPNLTDVHNPELRQRIEHCKMLIQTLNDVGLKEVGLESLSELLDDELQKKVCLEQLDRETHSLRLLKEWFNHIVLRFINYLATPAENISSRVYMWKDKMEK